MRTTTPSNNEYAILLRKKNQTQRRIYVCSNMMFQTGKTKSVVIEIKTVVD